MPEGPEVEITARQMHSHVAGRVVVAVDADGSRVAAAAGWVPQRIVGVSRTGKWISVRSTASQLWLHLGMSGRITLTGPGFPPEASPHLRVRWLFDDGTGMVFVDPRRFGRAHMAPTGSPPPGGRIGPDVFGDPSLVAASLTGSGRGIKSLLLDASFVAGVGNYMADTALFAARTHPCQRNLDRRAASGVAEELHAVALASLKAGGLSMRDWAAPDGTRGRTADMLTVFRAAGRPCPVCSATLEASKVAGRATTTCPQCQPQPS